MNKQLNIHPQSITFGSVTNLLNGAFASLSGPVGFTPNQPTIRVRRIQVTNPPGSSNPVEFSIFKGLSGGSLAGTQVLSGNVIVSETLDFETDFILESADFLTGECISNGTLVVNISADISF